MDRLMELLKQYRYGILVLLIGLGLMLLPAGEEVKEEGASVQLQQPEDIRESLEHILSQIEGAGRVSVLLTQSAGETTIYQQNTNESADTMKRETVMTRDDSRTETGLIKQVLPPIYQGAIVVCQGGDRASVQLAIVKAVSSVTGLTTDRITVLKMK